MLNKIKKANAQDLFAGMTFDNNKASNDISDLAALIESTPTKPKSTAKPITKSTATVQSNDFGFDVVDDSVQTSEQTKNKKTFPSSQIPYIANIPIYSYPMTAMTSVYPGANTVMFPYYPNPSLYYQNTPIPTSTITSTASSTITSTIKSTTKSTTTSKPNNNDSFISIINSCNSNQNNNNNNNVKTHHVSSTNLKKTGKDPFEDLGKLIH